MQILAVAVLFEALSSFRRLFVTMWFIDEEAWAGLGGQKLTQLND